MLRKSFKVAWYFLLFCYFSPCISSENTNDWELKMANVLYRHGDRSPTVTFPNDEHKNFWKQGLGQLTEIGKKQEFTMGQFLRQRYLHTLLNQTYLRKQVHCRSSDKDRCLMSAEAQMAGLYPPTDFSDIRNDSIDVKEWQFWQLIPIHTVPKQKDNLLRPYDYNCPRLAEIRQKSFKDPEYVKMEEKYKVFVANVSRNLGLVKSLTLNTIFEAYDLFFCQRAHNLTWPKWLTSDVFKNLTILQYFDFVWMFKTAEQRRLTGGVLLGEMIQNMNNFKKNPENSKKLYVYSAHDTTVVGLLSALKIYSGIPPPYSTAFLMELYKSKQTLKYFVRMFFRNDTSQPDHVFELVIPGCQGDDCSLYKFTDLTRTAVPVDYDAECHINQSACSKSPCEKPEKNSCKSLKDTLTAIFIIFLLTLIAVVGFVVRRCQKKRKIRSLAHFQQIQSEEWDSD